MPDYGHFSVMCERLKQCGSTFQNSYTEYSEMCAAISASAAFSMRET